MKLKLKYRVRPAKKRVPRASGAVTPKEKQKKAAQKPWAKVQSSVAKRKVA